MIEVKLELCNERNDLRYKLNSLRHALAFNDDISQAQRSLLIVQESIMESYIDVLNIRINDLQSGD